MSLNDLLIGEVEMANISLVSNNGELDKSSSMEVRINPSTIKQSFKINYEETTATGTENGEKKFLSSGKTSTELELLFDATGIFDKGYLQSVKKNLNAFNPIKNDNRSVYEDVKKFIDNFCKIKNETHEPNTILISWGDFQIRVKVEGFTVEYTLFNPNGKPIRAVVKLDLINDEPKTSSSDLKSPDLTHVRVIKAGDNLQLLTNEIYGDSKFYLEVAKVNKLVNFRNLTIGQKIFFPPLSK